MNKIKQLAISESGFIFDPSTGHSYTANTTGAFILKQYALDKSETEIIEAVMNEYEVDEVQVRQDLKSFDQEIHRQHLS